MSFELPDYLEKILLDHCGLVWDGSTKVVPLRKLAPGAVC